MKPIPVKETHRQAIEDALKTVNGNSTAHTYTTFDEIESLAQNADRALSTLMYKKDMVGVCCRSTSGKRVPNSYQNSRIATEVILKKTSTGWSLIEVQREYLYNDPNKEEQLSELSKPGLSRSRLAFQAFEQAPPETTKRKKRRLHPSLLT